MIRHCKNDLDNELWSLFYNEVPDEKAILKLIAKGANVNAVNEYDESLLFDIITIADDECEKKIKAVQLLLNAGADIHYVNTDGRICLHSAAVPWRRDIFNILLERGINPNCICTYNFESQLDNLETYEWLVSETTELSQDELEILHEMIQMLKDYGGKEAQELETKTLKNYLIVFASYETGLVTWDGYIEIHDIPGIKKETIAEFNIWKKSNPFPYDGQAIDFTNDNDTILVKEFNRQGLILSNEIKKAVGPDYYVHYFSIETDASDIKFRDLRHTVI